MDLAQAPIRVVHGHMACNTWRVGRLSMQRFVFLALCPGKLHPADSASSPVIVRGRMIQSESDTESWTDGRWCVLEPDEEVYPCAKCWSFMSCKMPSSRKNVVEVISLAMKLYHELVCTPCADDGVDAHTWAIVVSFSEFGTTKLPRPGLVGNT